MQIDMLQKIADFLRAKDGYTIITHESPDGDTLGSSLALFHALRKLGKRAEVVCCESVPKIYSFLPGSKLVRMPETAEGFANVIAVDCADKRRMGSANNLFNVAENTINIDHHGTNDQYAKLNDVSPVCAATGERIYQLICLLLGAPDRDMAECLYTALVTDTGNFSYSNTTAATFRIAADLLLCGLENDVINRRIFRSNPYRKVKLLGRAISKLQLFSNGKLGVTVITQGDMQDCGASAEDTEGIIDTVRDIDTVEVALFFKEGTEGFHVSFRSKEKVDVSVIAMAEGGGGHPRAAGCLLKEPFDIGYQRLISAVEEALSE